MCENTISMNIVAERDYLLGSLVKWNCWLRPLLIVPVLFYLDLPSGPSIVMVAAGLFGLALLFAPGKGAAWR